MEGVRGSWKGENNRPSDYLALAIAVMAVMGFGVAGAFALGSEVVSKVTREVGTPAANLLQTERITPLTVGFPHFSRVTQATSTNWGGYADTAKHGTILEVLGEWTVPKISCSVYPSVSDQWVGIDGDGTSTVEQGGTTEYCPGSGSPSYYNWFEFEPYEASVSVFSVSPGDFIQAYVLYNPYICEDKKCGIYTIAIEDISNPSATFLVQGNPSVCDKAGCEGGPDGSAECISESLVNQKYYLADYGTETFISCDVSINGYWSGIGGLPSGAGATVYEITCYGYDSGLKQQVPSKLTTYDYKNDHFTIKWEEYD